LLALLIADAAAGITAIRITPARPALPWAIGARSCDT
jgi:hypothetical protein